MSAKPVDAKKLTDEIIGILEARRERARAKDDKMDRELLMLKWFLTLMIPIALLMNADLWVK